jgi:hypothetical protein
VNERIVAIAKGEAPEIAAVDSVESAPVVVEDAQPVASDDAEKSE